VLLKILRFLNLKVCVPWPPLLAEYYLLCWFGLIQQQEDQTTHTLEFSVFTSRILATDFNKIVNQNHCNCSTHEVFFPQPNFFLAISSQSSSITISRDSLISSRNIASGRIHRKHRFHRYPNNTSIMVCLFRGKVFTETLPSNERLL
jgi:hypothetical protein